MVLVPETWVGAVRGPEAFRQGGYAPISVVQASFSFAWKRTFLLIAFSMYALLVSALQQSGQTPASLVCSTFGKGYGSKLDLME